MELRFTVNAGLIEHLQQETRISNGAELGRDALTLLNWAVTEVKSGRKIQSVDGSGNHPQGFSTPVLSSFPYAGE